MSLLHWKRTPPLLSEPADLPAPDARPATLAVMLGQLDEGIVCLLNNLAGLRHELTGRLIGSEADTLDAALAAMPEIQQAVEHACQLVSEARSRAPEAPPDDPIEGGGA